MKGLIKISVVFLLASALMLVSCAQQTGPAPSPVPSPAPSTPAAHKPDTVKIWAYPVGGSAYVVAFALADIINKNSKWLKAEAVESTGAVENFTLANSKPEMRRNLIWCGTQQSAYSAANGLPPYKFKYPSMVLLCHDHGTDAYFTLNPNIKTVKDLKGKTIGVFLRGTGKDLLIARQLEFYGIKEGDYKFAYLAFDKTADALKDGTIDAGFMGVSGEGHSPVPALAELAAQRKDQVYCIKMTEEEFAYASKTDKIPYALKQWPAGLAQGLETQAIQGSVSANQWCCDKELDPDIAYEVVSIAINNAKAFVDYFPGMKYWTPELASAFYRPLAEVHPATVKFFKERNITITDYKY